MSSSSTTTTQDKSSSSSRRKDSTSCWNFKTLIILNFLLLPMTIVMNQRLSGTLDTFLTHIQETTNDATIVAIGSESQAGSTTTSINCGCPHVCDYSSLIKGNSDHVCLDRIEFLMSRYGTTELEACEGTASNTTKRQADKPCGMECHPTLCKTLKPKAKEVSHIQDSHAPFKRHKGVAIVTKVLWDKDLLHIKQMVCLLNAAYNRHVNYDFIVFTTIPFAKESIQELVEFAKPARLTVELEGPPTLEEHVADMSPDELQFLRKRCNVSEGQPLTWFHYCREADSRHTNNLAYCWQAEFRAAHIYTHPALMKYKYMMWMDTDSLCTKDWTIDPIQVMIDNDLVILFDAFNYGRTSNPKLHPKLFRAYQKSLCRVNLNKETGTIHVEHCQGNDPSMFDNPRIEQVGGFAHITNLEIYRKPNHQAFLKDMVGDYRFSRQWDDQLGVTIPAAMEAPERSWDARTHGLNLGIRHHNHLDAKERLPYSIYKYWSTVNREEWDAGRIMCDSVMLRKP